ncbi:MAG: acyltransferase [Rikenellaceae bacterium]
MEDFWRVCTESDFRSLALETFRFQARHLVPYRDYLSMIECDVESVCEVEQIPFLPIELFKSCKIYCNDTPPEAVFTSSGDVSSRHYMHSLANYEEAFVRGFEHFYGDPAEWGVYALLPSYLEREGSSLIYMVDRLVARSEGRGGGFYLYDHQQLVEDMRRDSRPKILLGVSYALLDLAESGVVSEPLHNTIVMETGGMKGRREELSKRELHSRLCAAFGVERIASEYGMAELTSQGYSSGEGLFRTPPWMRVIIRDLADPFEVKRGGERGGVNIIDLASRYSCAFVETQDLGRVTSEGEFTIEGRISGSDIRGCNQLIE